MSFIEYLILSYEELEMTSLVLQESQDYLHMETWTRENKVTEEKSPSSEQDVNMYVQEHTDTFPALY